MLFEIILLIMAIVSIASIFYLGKIKKVDFSALLFFSLLFAAGSALIVLAGNAIANNLGMNIFSKENIQLIQEVASNSQVINGLNFISSLFTKLMKVSVLPLVSLSILSLIIKKREESSKKVFIYGIIGFVITVVIASLIGIAYATGFNLASGVDVSNIAVDESFERVNTVAQTAKEYNVFELLSSFLPTNIFNDLAQGNTIPVLIFIVLLGSSINRAKKRYGKETGVIVDGVTALFAALTYFVRTILTILPYSVYAMLVLLLLTSDFSSLTTLFTYVLVMLLSMITVFIISFIVLAVNKINPIQYLKNVSNPLLSAFLTASSSTTLPLSIEALKENSGVSNDSATIIPTLGTTMGMAACGAIYPSVIAIMAMNATGQSITVSAILGLLLIVLIASFGMQGVPGTAMYAATLVLTTLNLPLAIIVFVAPIDFFVDMFRTLTNVNGAMVVASVVDKRLGQTDEKVFNHEVVKEQD